MFWIAAALMTATVVAVLVTPLVRGGLRQRRAADYDLAVYRDQLAEVERSHAAGLLDDQEAESARTEIGRRILDADRRRQGGNASRSAPAWRRMAAVALAVLVPAAALGLYLDLGAPGTPDRPLAAREDVGGQRGLATAGSGSGQLIETARKLQARLRERPEDADAWRRLGEVRMRRERYGEAARALKQALEVGAGPATRALYGEALVMAEGGTVTEAAREAFERARAEGGGMPRAAFYLGLHSFQQGEPRAALDIWAKLARRAGSDAPWLGSVKEQMRKAEKRLGIEPGSTFARVANGAGQQPAGPTREELQAAREMSPDQRREMIRGMVERLATRLDHNPDDLAGWKRLARSYTVLDKPAKARDALAKAVELAPEDVDLLARYARALQRSGKTAKAIAVSRRMLEIAPKHPQALWFVAMEAAARGEREKARRLFDKALQQLPEDAPQLADLRKRVEQLLKPHSTPKNTQ
ncbi:cytochrome c-type biogenesis protein CcmH [Limimonas halophila]|uniref:Cytochrome c-type biogenesis protein CcmH n=1 Tax=Limimonas halophila TaxID=1082479 RepID=A0A1G7MGH4_9PROT|nr:c-type cytochrome biogenesis protein CcmI [Limimonas halophila]SDF60968.1 cytochrome c-type biogenesis protein CcmH [Limimonas halophila]